MADHNCPICQDALICSDPAYATTDACEHDFHFGCIIEWMVRQSACPLCRNEITAITHKDLSGEISSVKVLPKKQDFTDSHDNDLEEQQLLESITRCFICTGTDSADDGRLIECSHCGHNSVHPSCAPPDSLCFYHSEEYWMCQECREEQSDQDELDDVDSYISEEEDDMLDDTDSEFEWNGMEDKQINNIGSEAAPNPAPDIQIEDSYGHRIGALEGDLGVSYGGVQSQSVCSEKCTLLDEMEVSDVQKNRLSELFQDPDYSFLDQHFSKERMLLGLDSVASLEDEKVTSWKMELIERMKDPDYCCEEDLLFKIWMKNDWDNMIVD